MSGSGTDKTKSGVNLAGPVVILVEPQLGENIGMAARAMGNFALSRLRIVNPRDGWPNVSAQRAAAGADHILDHVELFETVEQAVADCTLLFATTARAHDQAKPVVGPGAAAREIVDHVASGGGAGILFGRERYGLQNEEVALANRIAEGRTDLLLFEALAIEKGPIATIRLPVRLRMGLHGNWAPGEWLEAAAQHREAVAA